MLLLEVLLLVQIQFFQQLHQQVVEQLVHHLQTMELLVDQVEVVIEVVVLEELAILLL